MELCQDCPPAGYPTDATRCSPCPRRVAPWSMWESAHLNGGREWFGYIFTCIEEPRLSRLDRYVRKTRSVTSTWRVDGVEMEDLAAALVAIKSPPVLTEERAMLELVGDDWARPAEKNWPLRLWSLMAKGIVEWKGGKCRRRKP